MSVFAISASGLRTAFRRQDVVANNLANLTTPGFKSAQVDQVDVAGGGTAIGSISVRLTQGPLELDEGAPFALAVNGEGFFQVDTPQGPRYTRAGSFHLDAEGTVVSAEGYPLSPGITVPSGTQSVQVDPQGVVSAVDAQGNVTQLGQISLTRFANPGGLSQEGSSLLAPTAASGDPEGGASGQVVFGALEGSNVDLGSEIVSQIVNRSFARANIAAIRTQDEMLGNVLDIMR